MLEAAIVDALTANKWMVTCESPLELEHADGVSRAHGVAADEMIDAVRVELDQKRKRSLAVDVGTYKLMVARDCMRAIFGKPDKSKRDKDSSGWTKERWQQRADLENQLCDYMSERSERIMGPVRKFKRVVDTDFEYSKLDAVSEDGHYIVDFRECNHVFEGLDKKGYCGVAISDWKYVCASIACGMPGSFGKKFPREHAFKAALFVYCDLNFDVFSLPMRRLTRLIRFHSTNAANHDEYPLLQEGPFRNDSDRHWFIPSCYWDHFGNLKGDDKTKFRSRREYVGLP